MFFSQLSEWLVCRGRRKRVWVVITLVILLLGMRTNGAGINFESEIAPLIAKRCLECHNQSDAKGGLNLTSKAGLDKGGDSGGVVTPGSVVESYLLQRIKAGEMPPKSRGRSQKLPLREIQLFQSWVEGGATWPEGRTLDMYEMTTDVRGGRDWWSFHPIKKPQVPTVSDSQFVANEIDAFILARLEQQGIQPAPPADPRDLVRRLYFDLVGLPPTREEIDLFVRDPSDSAYESLVDDLLMSKHHGERWARHWLDVVRYAETCGYERDQLKPDFWKYRDWVVKAFNNNMPYDRFVTHQLAGDEIHDRDEDSVIATGMIRAGTWNDEPNDPADYLYERLEDMVHTTSTAFLGLTVKCARCHDHKFDPIRQQDYYRMASFFWAGYIGQANLGGPTHEQLGFNVFGWTDRAREPDPIHLLVKGERHRPGEIVKPGFLSTVPLLDRPLVGPPAVSKTSHRRRQLAEWITGRQNPLTARVMVNRVWQQHFGQGIVRSPNNFGFKGQLPTHPQLLDWLARDFVDEGWSLKRLHKLLVMSRAYRQSTKHPQSEEFSEIDFANAFLWRANRRRLDAESLRDAMLSVSGRLNNEMGGPSFYPKMSTEALEGLSRKGNAWSQSSSRQRSRRSIYMMTKRSRILPLMKTFDFCDTTRPCGQRDVTTVAPQALAMLNNHFVHEQSDTLAVRVAEETHYDPRQSVQYVFQLALGRQASKEEERQSLAHLKNQLVHFREQAAHGVATSDKDEGLPINDKLRLWLRAGRGIELDSQNRVIAWRDQSGLDDRGRLAHDAFQLDADARPSWIERAFSKQPAVRFDGNRQFLHVVGQVVSSQQFTIVCVTTSRATGGTHEIISNWRRDDRRETSVFLGTSGMHTVRLTDDFSKAGQLVHPEKPFILSAVSAVEFAATYQNYQLLEEQRKLGARDLAAPYVLGCQGNIVGEYWHGHIAELLVYDRALDESELHQVWRYLGHRYGIEGGSKTPEHLALASLCHVLLNTNEFIYLD